MKYELIKDPSNMEMYGDIPCLPIEYQESEGERFLGEETDSWLLLDDFVSQIDKICPNDLDYGDVDYFDTEKCRILRDWLRERKNSSMSPRLEDRYLLPTICFTESGRVISYSFQALMPGCSICVRMLRPLALVFGKSIRFAMRQGLKSNTKMPIRTSKSSFQGSIGISRHYLARKMAK